MTIAVTDFKVTGQTWPAYPGYEQSDVDWLPKLPIGWDVRPLKYLTSFVSRGNSPTYVDTDGIPVINQACIQWNGINLKNLKYQERTDISDWKGLCAPGDILVNSTGTGTLGRSVNFTFTGTYMADSHVTIVRPLPAVASSQFLSYLLRTPLYQGYIYSAIVSGSTNQIELSREGLRQSPIVVPPLNEQCAIAGFLDRETAQIDALIAKKEQLIELLQEKRAALISHAVTNGLDPAAPTRDSGIPWIGHIPAHWEVIQLRRKWSVIDCKHRTAQYFDTGFPIVSTTEVKPGRLDLSKTRITSEEEYLDLIDGDRRPIRGDIIYSRNASVGSAAYVDTDTPFCMGQDVCRITSTDEDQLFLAYQLNSPPVLGQLDSLLVGSTFKRINVAEIRNYWIACPPVAEQHRISEYLDIESSRFERIIKMVQGHISLLHEHRTALISAAVTGKIDVRGEVTV